ncbi:NSE1 protein, partial [Polyodon spathula]|nr:NSE1 protein [Polyodon spathula]
MQIRKGMSEEDGQQYYALVNLVDTEITRMASDYSENELDLFRKAKNGECTRRTHCIKEIEHYIQTMYQDLVKLCNICNTDSLSCQQMCENPLWDKKHMPCVARYFQGHTEPHCPACNEFWPPEIPGKLTVLLL